MNIEEARQLAKEKIDELAQELERGESETLKAYLKAMAKFSDYSIGNTLLILVQKPDAERCAGLRTWNRLGRFVRRGERAITILAPCIKRSKVDQAATRQLSHPDHDRSQGEEDEVIVGFRGVCVFDVSQTDGAPLPEPACVNGDPGIYFDRLVQAVADRGIQLTYSPAIGRA